MNIKAPITNLKQKQALLRLLIFSIVTIMVWIGVSIFRSQNKTQLSPELQQLAQPLNPNIDADVLSRIGQKRSFSTNDLANFPINKIVIQPDGSEVIVRSVGGVNLPLQSSSSATPPPASPSTVTVPLTPVLPITPTASAAAKTR